MCVALALYWFCIDNVYTRIGSVLVVCWLCLCFVLVGVENVLVLLQGFICSPMNLLVLPRVSLVFIGWELLEYWSYYDSP